MAAAALAGPPCARLHHSACLQRATQRTPQAAAAAAAGGRQRRRGDALRVQATATSGAGTVLGKLARVFKEKAAQDLSRIVQGTSKTREKLGVRGALGGVRRWGWACSVGFAVPSRPACT